MSNGLNRKVPHPEYAHTMRLGARAIVVCFDVGYRQEPPPEVMAAWGRLQEAMRGVNDADVAMVRAWRGSFNIWAPMDVEVDPVIDNDVRLGFELAAQEAYPEYKVVSSWDNRSHGLNGYSVCMHEMRA